MPEDMLRELVNNARELLSAGYYVSGDGAPGRSLRRTLSEHHCFPVIAEVKLASPSRPELSPHRPDALIDAYVKGGAAALSMLTEPNHFKGSLTNLPMASRTGVPCLMKDFVIDERQLYAGASRGASAVLLIQEVFSRRHAEGRDELIELAHSYGLEVVLEAGSERELDAARGSEADILGINQRDLGTMQVDAGMAERILARGTDGRPVVVMSGMERPEQVRRARDSGASAVLVGSSLSSAADPLSALSALMVSR